MDTGQDAAGGAAGGPVAAPPPPAGPDPYTLAEQALQDGRIGDARTLLNRAVLRSGDTPQARLIAAEVLLASGDFRAAAEAFGALVAIPEVAAPALQGEGIALTLGWGEGGEGLASLHAAVERDRMLWRAWNAIGVSYDSRGDWRRAQISYDNALVSNPDSAVILNNRGFSLLMQGRVDEATADFNEALRRAPNLPSAQENLRLALAWAGQYDQALSGTDDGSLARALNNVGYVALLRGDYAAAEAYLLQAIEADPAYNTVAAKNLDYLRQLQDANRIARPQSPL